MTDEKKISWFKLMWLNNYIQLFALAIAFLVLEFTQKDSFYSQTAFWLSTLIPISMMAVIGYKGFIQFWKDYQSGKSR